MSRLLQSHPETGVRRDVSLLPTAMITIFIDVRPQYFTAIESGGTERPDADCTLRTDVVDSGYETLGDISDRPVRDKADTNFIGPLLSI